MMMEQSVPKHRQIKFGGRGITHKKEHNIIHSDGMWQMDRNTKMTSFIVVVVLLGCYLGLSLN
jgi:hypothetical protein